MKRYAFITIAALLIACPGWAAAQSGPQVLTPQVWIMAAGTGVHLSTSGGITFPAGNPSLETLTPATTALVATITIDSPKKNDTWNLTIRSAGSNFTGTSGSPISISNVRWSADGDVTGGSGSVSVSSGRALSTSDVTVASGNQGSHSPFIVQVTFTLTVDNSWTYDADTYLQNLVLTATAN